MKNKITYILLVLMIPALWSCHHHNHHGHSHSHDHGHSHSDIVSAHAHENGEIVFSPQQAQQTGLETETIHPASFHQVIKTSGEILPAQGDERTLSATVSGIVSFNKTALHAGTTITAGETILSISSRNIGEGDLSQKATASYTIAREEFERATLLIKDKLITQNEYNTIKLNYENANITYEAQGKNQTSKGTGITSPISGYIKNKLITEGEFVEIGQPLLTISQNRRLQLQADVSERYYHDLSHIVSANFSTPYDPALYKLAELNGKMVSYGKSAAGGDYYIPVNFEFDNAGPILPGSYVEIYLLSGTRENVLSVPVTALIEEQGIYSVYLKIDEEHYKKQSIQTGQSNGERIEIISGLQPGDTVVSKGAYHIKLAAASAAIPHSHEH